MPRGPREMNDRITEARMQKVIRYLLDQEVNRLLAQIADNTVDIAVNTADIDNVERRAAARNNDGLWSSSGVTGSGGSTISVAETPFSAVQAWTGIVPSQPINVALWEDTVFSLDADHDTIQFDAVQFDAVDNAQALVYTPSVRYDASTTTLTVDWGQVETGTLYIINHDDVAYSVVAVAI